MMEFTAEYVQGLLEKNLGMKFGEEGDYESLDVVSFEDVPDEMDRSSMDILVDDAISQHVPEEGEFGYWCGNVIPNSDDDDFETWGFYVFYSGEDEDQKPFAVAIIDEDDAVIKYSVILGEA
jgi:hypothetical protein